MVRFSTFLTVVITFFAFVLALGAGMMTAVRLTSPTASIALLQNEDNIIITLRDTLTRAEGDTSAAITRWPATAKTLWHLYAENNTAPNAVIDPWAYIFGLKAQDDADTPPATLFLARNIAYTVTEAGRLFFAGRG